MIIEKVKQMGNTRRVSEKARKIARKLKQTALRNRIIDNRLDLAKRDVASARKNGRPITFDYLKKVAAQRGVQLSSLLGELHKE